MSIKKGSFIWLVAGTISLVLATSGCATRRYVRNKVEPVDQRVAAAEATTAALSTKHDSDISAVHERISTTDMKLAETAAAVQQAQGTAARAMEASDANSSAFNAYAKTNCATVECINATLNFQLVDKADVLFGTNSSSLTKDDKATLDQIVQKTQSFPRSMVEVAGFADTRGTRNHNLILSNKRALAVQHYLAMQNVPVRSIHIIGLGEDSPPSSLESEMSAPQGASKEDVNRLARRVGIRIFAAPATAGSAGRSE